MTSVSTLAKFCPLRGWFFQRYREPLSLAVQHHLLSNQSSQPVTFQTARIRGSTDSSRNTTICHELLTLPARLCQPFNTHKGEHRGAV